MIPDPIGQAGTHRVTQTSSDVGKHRKHENTQSFEEYLIHFLRRLVGELFFLHYCATPQICTLHHLRYYCRALATTG